MSRQAAGAEMHDTFFKEIHDNQNLLDTPEKIRALFGKFGVDAATSTTESSPCTRSCNARRAEPALQDLSVPTIVVNGKYTTDGGMAGNYDDLFALVGELAASERAGSRWRCCRLDFRGARIYFNGSQRRARAHGLPSVALFEGSTSGISGGVDRTPTPEHVPPCSIVSQRANSTSGRSEISPVRQLEIRPATDDTPASVPATG
jgi:hypothetical protein